MGALRTSARPEPDAPLFFSGSPSSLVFRPRLRLVFARTMVGGVQDIGKKKFRPMSPHLHVYVPQLTSVLSICHRITGCALAFSCISGLIISKMGDYSIT